MNQKLPIEIQQKINSVAEDLLFRWNHYHSSVPFSLYHYTSAAGLIGIIESSSLHMTDLRYMNDLSELQYGTEVVHSALDQMRTKYSSSKAVGTFIERIVPSSSSTADSLSIYSMSFCENGNLLSQWRAYGSRGGGYAIGMDIPRVLPFFSRYCELRRVIYDRSEQNSLVFDFAERFCELLVNEVDEEFLSDETSNYLIPRVCAVFSSVFTDYINCFKHPDFAEEREWRLLFSFNVQKGSDPATYQQQRLSFEKQIEFRDYSGNVVPYVVNSFRNAIEASKVDSYGIPFPIAELIIGPTLSPELNRNSILSLIRKQVPDVTPLLLRSGIPLRWL